MLSYVSSFWAYEQMTCTRTHFPKKKEEKKQTKKCYDKLIVICLWNFSQEILSNEMTKKKNRKEKQKEIKRKNF